jgi:hypothetical protein
MISYPKLIIRLSYVAEIALVRVYSQPRKQNLHSYFGLIWATILRSKANPRQSEQQPILEIKTILCKTSELNGIPSSRDQVKFSKDFKSALCPQEMQIITNDSATTYGR